MMHKTFQEKLDWKSDIASSPVPFTAVTGSYPFQSLPYHLEKVSKSVAGFLTF